MAPQVSVVMSAYNRARYLRECVESILNQSLIDFEFIIIDDGSTDNSWEILTKSAAQDQRIVLIQNQENIGIARSRNKGMARAQGEFIAVMDSDDVALANRFETQVEYLQKHPDCVAVGSDALVIDSDGWPIGVYQRGQFGHEVIEERLLSGRGGVIIHPSAMIRRSALEKIGGYNPELRHSVDFDMFIRLTGIGKLANIPQVLLKYREHCNRVTNNKTRDSHSKTIHAIVTRAWKERKLGSPPEHLCQKQSTTSPTEWRKRWAIKAMNEGYYLTSFKYLSILLIKEPHSLKTWKLALKALAKFTRISSIIRGRQSTPDY